MDFTSLYSTRIKNSFDEDQAEILKIFRAGAESKEGSAVTIINYYKGLPITYSAKVVGVERGSLDLDVHPQQAVAIAADHYALIRSKLFPLVIAANVQYVNVKKHAVSLNKLGYVELLAELRDAVRLELEPPMEASIKFGDMLVSGKLIDISAHGAAISTDFFPELERGTAVTLNFVLPDPVLQKDADITTTATLVRIDGNRSPYLCRFRCEPEKHHEQLISRYGFQRQVEIIRGLKEATF